MTDFFWSEKIMNLRKSFFFYVFQVSKRAKISHQPRLPASAHLSAEVRVSICIYSLCLFTLSLSSYTRLYLHTCTPLLNVTPRVYTVPRSLSILPSVRRIVGWTLESVTSGGLELGAFPPFEWANLNKKDSANVRKYIYKGRGKRQRL